MIQKPYTNHWLILTSVLHSNDVEESIVVFHIPVGSQCWAKMWIPMINAMMYIEKHSRNITPSTYSNENDRLYEPERV